VILSFVERFLGIEEITWRKLVRSVVHRFKNDSLFRNSFYLMLSTAIMSVFGFIFWIIAARAYTPSQVGFATALISLTVLLSIFSLLGFNIGLVRFLPKSPKPNETINTAILSTALATLLISGGFLLGIHHFAPAFSELTSNPLYAILFLILMVMVSVNTLTDSVFTAYRAANYNTIVYSGYSLIKVGLPLVLVSFGAYGVFFAYTGSIIVATALSFYFMVKKFGYRFHWNIERKTIASIGKYSIGNYISSLLATTPMLAMPAFIINHFGARQAAFYYMASTIAAMLIVIPTAITQALLAESSHDEGGLMSFVKGSAKLIGALLIPAVLILVVGGQYILAIFGKSYAKESADLLDVMAITTIVMAANMVLGTIMRIRHQIKEMLLINLSGLIATVVFVFLLLGHGVMGVTIALLLSQLWMALQLTAFFWFRHRRRTAYRYTAERPVV
jgi:O-antigen/teichoic acid export membrane protein